MMEGAYSDLTDDPEPIVGRMMVTFPDLFPAWEEGVPVRISTVFCSWRREEFVT